MIVHLKQSLWRGFHAEQYLSENLSSESEWAVLSLTEVMPIAGAALS
jgi:hypothetical protein